MEVFILDRYKPNADIFKAFCDVKRLAIIDLLKSGEQCACVLQSKLGLTQSGLSYHMKILLQSGIVSARQEGKWTHYKISKDGCETAIKLLKKITDIPNEYCKK